ncbi:hypothetical protein NFJ02_33g83420 [Pycnococcus provasolii]
MGRGGANSGSTSGPAGAAFSAPSSPQHGVAAASTRNSGMRLTREPVRPSRIRHHTLGSTNRFSEGVSKRLMARLDAATRGIDAPLNAHAEPAQHQLATAAAAAMGGQTPSSTLNSAQMLHNDLATNTNAFNSTTGSLNDVYNNSLNNNSFTSPPLSPKASLSRLQQGLNVDAPSFDLGDPRRALSPPPGGWRDATATAVAGVHQSINGSLLLRKQPEPWYRDFDTQGGITPRITGALRMFQSAATDPSSSFPRPRQRQKALTERPSTLRRTLPTSFLGPVRTTSRRAVESETRTTRATAHHGYDGEFVGLFERVSRDLQQRGQSAETAFKYFDRDQDGKLNASDVSIAVRAMSMPVTKRGRSAFAHELLDHATSRHKQRSATEEQQDGEEYMTKDDLDEEVVNGGFKPKGGRMHGTRTRVHNAFEICFARNKDFAVYMSPALYAHDRRAAAEQARQAMKSLPPLSASDLDVKGSTRWTTRCIPPYAAVCEE